uniref:exportin-7-like n=1 Tax=Styela clava TaxID=7725 RepID=UPI00193A79F2|nr:exportin-7-like [Styela clava]
MMEQEVAQLETFCAAMFETADPATRQHAEKVLVEFASDPTALEKCQMLFQRAISPFSQHLAATTLTKIVTKPGSSLTLQQKLDIRNYVLNYLYTGQKLAPFVIQGMIQLFVRITKLSWFEGSKGDWLFRKVIEDVTKFLQADMSQCIIGVQILNMLVNEMNESESVKPLTRHRKIAATFRDSTLFNIFQLHCGLLQQATSSDASQFEDPMKNTLISILLDLGLSCLSFDFIGTSHDESSDDLCTVQVPTSWRSVFLDQSTMLLYFELYKRLPLSLCATLLSCLVQMASVRRTLLNNAERSKFLSDLLSGIKGILENSQKLADASVYHEFCRLLARLKSNYQLGELVKVSCYTECMRLIANFTVTSLRMWQFSPNSLHYLLSLWQRMAASVPYVKAQEPHSLDTYTPEITKAFIDSRLESVAVILRDDLEDPLNDIDIIRQQLDQISTIARCEYEKTCEHLVRVFDESASGLQKLLQANADDQQLALPQGQLTWIVYLIGAVIGGRVSFASNDDHDAMDGELVLRVLQLMEITDTRLTSGHGFANIELALLSFFEQYRKIYVGDQVQKTSKVYKRLSEVLQITDDSMILNVFVTKIIKNLKYWSNHEPIITKTLQLLNDLSIGYSSVRKLVKLEAIQFLLKNHNSTQFPFLGVNSPITDLRCRTTLYMALGRLLIVDLGEDEERFDDFMSSLSSLLDSLVQMLRTNLNSDASLNNIAMRTMIGLSRDLHGITYAFNTKSSYAMLFDWLYPHFMSVMQKAIDVWCLDPTVTTPVLKMMSELVLNRGQRLQFEVSSPNGILLFQEASKMICLYGERILQVVDLPKEKVYSHRLKGVSLCFTLLKQSLCGNYVNFGVFRLYNDPTLDDVLNMFMKLVMSVPATDVLDYPKLSISYYTLLEVLAQDHMNFLTGLPSHMMHRVMSSISEGLTALDTMICTCCCATLDNMVTHLFRLMSRSPTSERRLKRYNHDPHAQERNQHFLQVMTQHPEMLQKMMSTVLNMIMFEDCRNQWSMSRPLLGLILLNQEFFNSMQKSICETEFENHPTKMSAIQNSFSQLMDGVERNLLTKNRDRFTQNLSLFRRDINQTLRSNSSTGVGLDLSQSGQMS